MRRLRWPVLAAALLVPVLARPEPISEPTASVRLILNDPSQFPKPGDRCQAEVCTSLLSMIKGARKSIDFALYGMRGQTALLNALRDAKARGVTIRGVVDRDAHNQTYYTDTGPLQDMLGTVVTDFEHDRDKLATWKPYESRQEQCDRPVGFDGPLQCLGYDLGESCLVAAHASREEINFDGDIMHDKFFVVDGRYTWMGSTNASDSGTGGYNANLVMVLDSPQVARWYTREVDQMVAGKFHEDKQSYPSMYLDMARGQRLQLMFSPQDQPITRKLRKLIQDAQQNIDVAVFFLTHKAIAGDLIDAHRRGVKVRVIIDATAATNGYTKHELLRAAGIPVKIENWGGKMHMKSAMIDDEIVIGGSMNWTSAGEGGNDENTIILYSRDHAAQYRKYFEKIWTMIPDKWLTDRPDPESKDSIHSCDDGSDNDFDRLRDADDPGCGPHPPALSDLPPWKLVAKGRGEGLIKGDITRDGKRLYHVPGGSYYSRVEVEEARGERWFCSEKEAMDAGWKKSWN